jgi:tetratricopeptide (TPR) repeat protein
MADMDQAIRLNPKNVFAINLRGSMKEDLGQIESAIADFDSIISTNPNLTTAILRRASAFGRKKEFDSALADVDRALSIEPKSIIALNLRCYLWTMKGDPNRGILDCNEAIRIDPKFFVAYSSRCEALLARTEIEAAITDCTEAARLDPDGVIGLYSLGLVYEAQGRFREAIDKFTAALALSHYNYDSAQALKRVQQKLLASNNEKVQVKPVVGAVTEPTVSNKTSTGDSTAYNTFRPGATPDLLELQTSIRIQKRLSELGYFKDIADGTWGPHSRLALAKFKFTNGLSFDDALDPRANDLLFSANARPASTVVSIPNQSPTFVRFSAKAGTSLHPLNSGDAARINSKLRELGFFNGKSGNVWSLASRKALRDFKAKNNLPFDDGWDVKTEKKLFSSLRSSPRNDVAVASPLPISERR